MTRKQKIFLGIIILLGIFLRFYKLGDVPIGFHRDEAYLSYNAYSILKTGKDISGQVLPLHLSSFFYSPAGYVYFSIPFIWIFGLSEFSARFASAFFGSLLVPLTFLIVISIFSKRKEKYLIGLGSSFLMAISPWNINLSRTATDNVLVAVFIVLGVIFFKLWMERNKFYYVLVSFLFFFLCLFTYQSSRSFLPFFIPLIIFYFSREKKSYKKIIQSLLLYLLLIVIPVIFIIQSPTLSKRISQLSIVNNPETQLILDEQIREDGALGITSLESRIFHNKAFNYSSTFLKNYFDHFSYKFLFTDSGFPDRYRIPFSGLLYIFELPLILLGIWMFIRNYRKESLLFFSWIIITPIGSALTFDDVPNLQRTFIIFPALSIVSGIGLVSLVQLINKLKYRIFGFLFVFGLIVFNVFSYLHSYYIQSIQHRPWFRQEGYKQLVNEVNNRKKNYDVIRLTNGQSAIFLLFYNKYDPVKIHPVASKTDQAAEWIFDKFTFTKDDCPATTKVLKSPDDGKKVLYVNDGGCKIPVKGVRLLREIKRPDNSVAFRLFDRN